MSLVFSRSINLLTLPVMPLDKNDKIWINMALEPIVKDITYIKESIKETKDDVRLHDEVMHSGLLSWETGKAKIEQLGETEKEHTIRIELLEKNDLNHIRLCPVSPKLRVVEDELLVIANALKTDEENKKYLFSKTTQLVIVIIMLIGLFLSGLNWNLNRTMNKEINKVEQSVNANHPSVKPTR
jgi:preprotein translocase subunit SecE